METPDGLQMITVPASLPVTAAAQKRPAAVNGQVGIGLAVYIMVLKGGGDVRATGVEMKY